MRKQGKQRMSACPMVGRQRPLLSLIPRISCTPSGSSQFQICTSNNYSKTSISKTSQQPVMCGRCNTPGLSPQAQCLNQTAISLNIIIVQIVEQPTALTDQFQQTSPRMVVLFVLPQVVGQILNTRRYKGYLHLRRSRVLAMDPELFDYLLLIFDS